MQRMLAWLVLVALASPMVSAELVLTRSEWKRWENGVLVEERSGAEANGTALVLVTLDNVDFPATVTATSLSIDEYLIEPDDVDAAGCVEIGWTLEGSVAASASGVAAAAASAGSDGANAIASASEDPPTAVAEATTDAVLRIELNSVPVVEIAPIDVESPDASDADAANGTFLAMVGDTIALRPAAAAAAVGLPGGSASANAFAAASVELLGPCPVVATPTVSEVGRGLLIGALLLVGLGVLRSRLA